VATITKRKRKDGKTVYFVQIRKSHAPARRKTFMRYSDAKQWAAKVELEQEQLAAFGGSLIQPHSFKELAEIYLKDYLSSGEAAKKSDNTRRAQIPFVHDWMDILGRYQLKDITPLMIERARESLRVPGRGNSSLNRRLNVLSHIFRTAIDVYGWMRENPCKKLPRYPEPNGRIRFLSKSELKRLLEAVDKSPYKPLSLIVRMALITGMRKMEILSLTWEQINFETGLLELPKTKNSDRRVYPLPKKLLTDIQNHKQYARSTLLFPAHNKPDKPIIFYPYWRLAIKEASIQDFRFHDLRHTAASYLAMSGESLRTITDVLGHRSISTTMRYTHLSQEHKGRALELLQNKIKID